MDEALIAAVSASVLRRRGIVWAPGTPLATQAREAAAAAIGLLRSFAGGESLSLDSGEGFDLAAVAAWYLMEQRRAEFLAEYRQELLMLRMQGAVEHADN